MAYSWELIRFWVTSKQMYISQDTFLLSGRKMEDVFALECKTISAAGALKHSLNHFRSLNIHAPRQDKLFHCMLQFNSLSQLLAPVHRISTLRCFKSLLTFCLRKMMNSIQVTAWLYYPYILFAAGLLKSFRLQSSRSRISSYLHPSVR